MTTTIRTPDQRVRVFISSTIQELAEERKAAREAIERLQLIPVFFEAGARPHPPRDLYRAYLEQSHIFLGIYWNRYGWVAPGMDISGLEDEYLLSDGKPRLIYIKKTEGEREDGMQKLLGKIEEGGAACFQKFSTADELKNLLITDLSILLSEHFQAHHGTPEISPTDKRTPLPADRVVLIGRGEEIKSIKDLLLNEDVSLVTITGAGGTGKTRLGIHIANEFASRFPDGVFYAPLSTLHEKESFIPFITRHFGFYDSGKQDLKEALIQYLSDKRCLLLLDNFEQIVSAASEVADLLSSCRHMKVLVTSRTPLHISGEHIFPLMPLAVTYAKTTQTEANPEDIPAVQLFIQRAREINPAFPLDHESKEAILLICKKLNGIPLAIELASARTRLLSPTALAGRMSNMLETLVHGRQDSPDRHRTLRATIDWSHDLLDDQARTIFRRLAVLSGFWTIQDAESIVNWEQYDVFSIIEKLLDVSLIQCTYLEGENAFSMFEAVREYAFEQQEKYNETEALRKAHLDYHLRLVEEFKPFSWSSKRVVWFKRLEKEAHHIRDAFDYALIQSNYTAAWDFIQGLGYYWSFNGKITEAVKMIELAKVSVDEKVSGSIRSAIPQLTQAGALRTSGMIHFFANAFQRSVSELQESTRIYLEQGQEMDAGRAMSYLGVSAISAGDFQASAYFEKAIAISRKYGDNHNLVIASAFLSEVMVAVKQPEKANELVTSALEISRRHGDALLIALSLGQQGNVNLILGNYEVAEKSYLESISYNKVMPLGSMKGWFEIGLAYCYHIRDDRTDAMQYFITGLQSGRQVGDLAIVLSGFFGLAAMALMDEQYSRAAWLCGAAETLISRSGYTLWNATRKVQQEVMTKLEAYPHQEIIKIEKEKGARASLDEAVGVAIKIS